MIFTFRALVFFLALIFLPGQAFAFETAYWAWQRNDPPNEGDLAELSAQGVRTLYWQLGELENVGQGWRWKARFHLPTIPKIEIVPVVRLESHARAPFTDESMRSLLGLITGALNGRGNLQLDYDCPDRLLPEYAQALRQIRGVIPRLSITALPGWGRLAALEELGKSVDELLPMFYDFEPDPIVTGASPVPLIVPERMQRALAEWDRCPTPWRVGLPNFARLTVYDPDGKSPGHVREWNWDAITFNHGFTLVRPTALGVTLFRASAASRVGNTRIKEGQLLAARWPDLPALAAAITAARQTSARGLVIFRLPDSTAASGWSLRQLQHPEAGPRLVLKWSRGLNQLVLANAGDGDLAPNSRGYVMQVEAGQAIFREAEEGDFWRVRGEIESGGQGSSVLIPLATRLSFSFSQLRAGETLRSGLIQLAPAADFAHARFRIVNTPQAEWKLVVE